jgi:diadenosine tetraphosphate (Ap4A) HIT family hydrolase
MLNLENCEPCNPSEELKKLSIKDYEYWRVGLHKDQTYLGRSVVVLNRHIEDPLEVTDQERVEWLEAMRELRNAITLSFETSKMNYAEFGNEVEHVHWHVVPRYEKPVEFAGITFTDKRWGKNYSPYESLLVPDEVKYIIRDTIKENL